MFLEAATDMVLVGWFCSGFRVLYSQILFPRFVLLYCGYYVQVYEGWRNGAEAFNSSFDRQILVLITCLVMMRMLYLID